MSFRDDREAMMAHLESLRRELAIARAERDAMAARAASLEAANAKLTFELEALRARLPPPPAPPPPRPTEPPAIGEILFQISEPGSGSREVRLSQSIIKIGRLGSSHLKLDDEEVSRMHAVIEVANGVVSVIDLGSTRGTLLNGERVNKATVSSGDLITVGDSSIRVYFGW